MLHELSETSQEKICETTFLQEKTHSITVNSTSIESPETFNPQEVPLEYLWLPYPKVYPLSVPEQKAMEEYIEEALKQEFIHPSTSPATSSFFFVGKKDGGLRPCIDYPTLNSHAVKYRYPLPLVQAALEHLCGARIFTKLNLWSAYNLV